MVHYIDHGEKRDGRIRSLAKGLDVLAAVNDLAPVKVASLVKATHLPKPTLIRILNTLVAEGYVIKRRREEGGGYFPTPKVRLLASVFAQGSLLNQIAQRHLNSLCEIVKWPAELLVRDGLSMLIEGSNRHISPISLKSFEQKRFPILNTGSGQAYLAWLKEPERRELISAALATTSAPQAFYADGEKTEQVFQTIRQTGYTLRDYDTPIEGTRLYSVPLLHQDGYPIAVLVLVTLRDVVSTVHFEEKLFPVLMQAAKEISRDFQKYSKFSTLLP